MSIQGSIRLAGGNPAQIEAVTHMKGPALVLAGPGSGKTYVITERIRFLIENGRVDPASILVITFTRAAASEMQERFCAHTCGRYPEVTFGTFHSVFYRMLMLSKRSFHPKIMNYKDKCRLINEAVSLINRKNNIDDILSQDDIDALLCDMSRVRNNPTKGHSIELNEELSASFDEIMESYNKLCREYGMIDFDDMQILCRDMLKADPDILGQWKRRFRYILIDEYQDINPVQDEVIRLLGGKSGNVFAVGDDDQSIYGFRGADPGMMKAFLDHYENVHLVKLVINYRSGSEIIRVSRKMIAGSPCLIPKEVIPASENSYSKLEMYSFEDPQKENAYICRKITHILNEDPKRNIAVLFRTNSEVLPLAALLSGSGIDYYCKQACSSIYEDKSIDMILSYMRFGLGGHKRSDFYKLMNHPVRYIRREAFKSDKILRKDYLSYYANEPAMIRKIDELMMSLDIISRMRPALAVRYILEECGLRKQLTNDLTDSSRQRVTGMLEEMSRDAAGFSDIKSFLNHAEEMKKAAEKSRNNSDNKEKRVSLMTFHASKGLEFDAVFIPGINEGIMPSRRSVDERDIEEERRMLYVGFTRAKRELYLSYVRGEGAMNKMPSRFIRPIISEFGLYDESALNTDLV